MRGDMRTSEFLGFNGQLHEAHTRWQLLGNGHRVYNPTLMRFHSPDTVSPFGAGGINSYAYTHGDPVNLVDPSGKTALSVLMSAIGKFKLSLRRMRLAGMFESLPDVAMAKIVRQLPTPDLVELAATSSTMSRRVASNTFSNSAITKQLGQQNRAVARDLYREFELGIGRGVLPVEFYRHPLGPPSIGLRVPGLPAHNPSAHSIGERVTPAMMGLTESEFVLLPPGARQSQINITVANIFDDSRYANTLTRKLKLIRNGDWSGLRALRESIMAQQGSNYHNI
ncbi:hypothetical protein GA830_14155 [Mesorhizobium sp. NBSH29]|nr:hypothetical protein GA830_14155 [Mesorhizobium sp. NBSH29]